MIDIIHAIYLSIRVKFINDPDRIERWITFLQTGCSPKRKQSWSYQFLILNLIKRKMTLNIKHDSKGTKRSN